MSKWVGYAVSVNCGEPLGCYQGTILEADGTTITLTKAFRNGFPYPKSKVTLNAADIKELKIIEERAAPPEQTHSTVAVSKGSGKGASGKKPQRATVCESLQANPSSSGNQSVSGGGKAGAVRTKPIDIQQPAARGGARNTHTGSYGTSGSTPKARGGGHERARRRNEACFGDAADPALDHDFDFEGNLALFDKRALWEEMSAQRPDVVRAADGADGAASRGKYRHDENVLGGTPVSWRPIRVPDELRGPVDFDTDEGLVVPSVTAAARRRLWEGLERYGLADGARLLLARAITDVALRLVGGGRRLDPRNAHQAPTCAVLAGNHPTGVVGLLAARLLASHGVRIAVHVTGDERSWCSGVRREVGLLALSGAAPVGVSRLGGGGADAVVAALGHDSAPPPPGEAADWAAACRAPIVAVETGMCGARALVQALLPECGGGGVRRYLADVAPPARLFHDLAIAYRPPFGACSVLSLHPRDE